jgi:hypothetical protein
MPDKYPGSSTLANKTETGTSQPPRHDQFPHWWSVICVMALVRDHGSSMAALLGVQPEPTLGDIVQATVICISSTVRLFRYVYRIISQTRPKPKKTLRSSNPQSSLCDLFCQVFPFSSDWLRYPPAWVLIARLYGILTRLSCPLSPSFHLWRLDRFVACHMQTPFPTTLNTIWHWRTSFSQNSESVAVSSTRLTVLSTIEPYYGPCSCLGCDGGLCSDIADAVA